ncbi:MAG TPA: DUF2203 domain-containing protein [Candidatus Limnocylindria bacterium]|nr:DUF2203 domain-containing protein [Candidatus Limnocylindria bacterium]
MPGPRQRYTIEEANALIPQVRAVILQLAVEGRRLEETHAALHRRLAGNGDPASAEDANRMERESDEIADGMRSLASVLEDLGVRLRDLDTGLVDFPGERDGQAVWLCWRLADPEVAWWHGTDEGFASRKPW